MNESGRRDGAAGRRFAYYRRLSRAEQQIYRRSDERREVQLPHAAELRALVPAVEAALAADSRERVAAATAALVAAVLRDLGAPPVRVRVLLKRPAERNGGELHGLYVATKGEAPVLSVWMRTAARKQPVRLRTFVHTVMHEIVHHLDFHLFGLAPSFHCEGFFAREAHLSRQLLGGARASAPAARVARPARKESAPHPRKRAAEPPPKPERTKGPRAQLSLFD